MAFLTGCLLLDCPASALNNAGADTGSRTDNAIVVKKISTPEGTFPYVSAQAVRYWLRNTLEHHHPSWKAAPVHREGKIAYTDADPLTYWDDDLLGYMRAPSKKADANASALASPLEKDRDITRVSPLRVSTFVSVSPVRVTTDFGTMTRQEGNPVPYEHEFYRTHLLGSLSLDLRAAGTFFDSERVGFRNLDSHRRDNAKARNLESLVFHKQPAFRLPIAERRARVSTLISGLATLQGGAKLSLHYTDVAPVIFLGAVLKHGNNPFYRSFSGSKTQPTYFHQDAFREALSVFADDLLSPIYFGWTKGFLDDERAKLDQLIPTLPSGITVQTGHPVEVLRQFQQHLETNDAWLA
ncbi:MAG: type I-B CRISPR-associated protein Cas7/Cst2/DevR [Acidobacteria bacterium]|nr:type I-B CRISPR-associated protein Cas7/Cst2/DevR [Acidobacteriota bacterium]